MVAWLLVAVGRVGARRRAAACLGWCGFPARDKGRVSLEGGGVFHDDRGVFVSLLERPRRPGSSSVASTAVGLPPSCFWARGRRRQAGGWAGLFGWGR